MLQKVDIRSWMQAHDQHPWDRHKQTFRIRGPTRNFPAAVEERNEFGRAYNPVGPTIPPTTTDKFLLNFDSQPLVLHTPCSDMEGHALPIRQEVDSDCEDVIYSGNFDGRGTSSTSRPPVPVASAQPSFWKTQYHSRTGRGTERVSDGRYSSASTISARATGFP
jgi:hypothetical protein